ncbi:hypothetical protein BDP55DRAFT_634728 [Colletotrichum godetiae]|uniref:Uncharacterized protein n=1 Tax=Colletotrichum godetiae TaxID=1209918 RepID=A0AAJ0AGB8_9PEZI|nr:uncharacterized protein BDP55DRAFT_634728 [Colletotrichum godetiae]KAK1672719.1 hypothetical protein BDP55DRAFT_634728 [Colletotrichum godetiae]
MSWPWIPRNDLGDEQLRNLQEGFERYKPRTTVTLCPREPGISYGLPEYGPGIRPESNEWRLPNFNPTIDQPDHEAQVEIIECLKGGIEGRALVPSIRHDTHHPPTRGLRVVLKVFDSAFFPQQLGIFLREHAPSDLPSQLLSREANAYEYFYNQGMTGNPHMTRRWRCAGAVLIEHIQGQSLEKICKRHESGALIPDQAMLPFPDSASDQGGGLQLKNLPSRLNIFKQIVHGGVCFKHVGADLTSFDGFIPRNMFLTFDNDSQLALENVRPVLLDYSRCVIWSQSRQGTHGRLDEVYPDAPPIPSRYVLDKSPMQRLPRPPHPLIIYNHVSWLQDFEGWCPVDWMERESDKFEVWVKSEFGEPEQQRTYSTVKMLEEKMQEVWNVDQERYEMEKPSLIARGRIALFIQLPRRSARPKQTPSTKHTSCILEESENSFGNGDGLFRVIWMQNAKIHRLLRWAPRRSQLRELRHVRKRVMAVCGTKGGKVEKFSRIFAQRFPLGEAFSAAGGPSKEGEDAKHDCVVADTRASPRKKTQRVSLFGKALQILGESRSWRED